MSTGSKTAPAFPRSSQNQNTVRASFWENLDSINTLGLDVHRWKDRSFHSPLVVSPGSEGSIGKKDVRGEISLEALKQNVLENEYNVRHGDSVEVAFLTSDTSDPEVYKASIMATEELSDDWRETAQIYDGFPLSECYENGFVLVDQRPSEMRKGRYDMVVTDPSLDIGEEKYFRNVEAYNQMVTDVANILAEGVESPDGDASYAKAMEMLDKDTDELGKENY